MLSLLASSGAITKSTASHEHLKTPLRQQLQPKAATDPLANRPRHLPPRLSLPSFLFSIPCLTSATLSNSSMSYSDSLPSANQEEDAKPEPVLGEYEDMQLLVDRQLETEAHYGFSNVRYSDDPLPPWPRLSSCSPGPPPRNFCTPRKVTVAPCGSPNNPEAEEVEESHFALSRQEGMPSSPSYCRQRTPHRQGMPYSDPEDYTRQSTPFSEDTPHSVQYRREETPCTDGYSSYDEVYLRTPNPRKTRDFNNDWGSIPTSQMLWRPPSRDGVRRSERLQSVYSPLLEKQNCINKTYNFFKPTPLKAMVMVLFAISFVLFSRTTVPYAIPPIQCLLNPLCTPWHASRIQTTHSLLSHTTRHSTALLTLQNATTTHFLPIPHTLSTLVANIRTEATFQQRLARTRDEITAADSLFTIAQEILSTQRSLQQTQTSLNTTISLSIGALRRFSDYLLYQNPSIPRQPTSWERGVPHTNVARESTIRKNFDGHVGTLRVLYAAMEYELFAAEKRVAEAVSGLKEGTMHRNAFFSLRRVVRVLEELRMVELKALGMALVETGEEGVEEEEALGWRFESFYGVLEVLEGRSERSYGLADVAHESLGVRSGGSEGEDMVEPEVDGKKAGKGEFGSRGEQGAEILKAEPANGVEGLEVTPIATGEGAGL